MTIFSCQWYYILRSLSRCRYDGARDLNIQISIILLEFYIHNVEYDFIILAFAYLQYYFEFIN